MNEPTTPEPASNPRPRRRRSVPAEPAATSSAPGVPASAPLASAPDVTAPAPPAPTPGVPASEPPAPTSDTPVAAAEPADPAPVVVVTPLPLATTGGVDAVQVDHLAFERGAIGGVRATDVTARQAVVGGVAANQVSVERGVVSGIVARDATVQQGLVRGVLAQNVHLDRALVRSVVANRVEAGPSTAILVAVARSIDGEAKVLLDWRGGLAFGAALGAFLLLIRISRR